MMKSVRTTWAEHVASMGEKRNACRIFIGNPEEIGLLGRPRHVR
jgi:hypothetical protein